MPGSDFTRGRVGSGTREGPSGRSPRTWEGRQAATHTGSKFWRSTSHCEQRSGRFRETISLRHSAGGVLLHAVLHSPRLGTTLDADVLFVLCCLQLWWNPLARAKRGVGRLGSHHLWRTCLAAARAGLGPISLFLADRSHSRVTFTSGLQCSNRGPRLE